MSGCRQHEDEDQKKKMKNNNTSSAINGGIATEVVAFVMIQCTPAVENSCTLLSRGTKKNNNFRYKDRHRAKEIRKYRLFVVRVVGVQV